MDTKADYRDPNTWFVLGMKMTKRYRFVPQDREECVNEILYALSRLKKETPDAPESWWVRTARFAASHWRRRHFRRRPISYSPKVLRETEERMRAHERGTGIGPDEFADMVSGLPVRMQALLTHHFVDGGTLRDSEESKRTNEVYARRKFHAALRLLRRSLTGEVSTEYNAA